MDVRSRKSKLEKFGTWPGPSSERAERLHARLHVFSDSIATTGSRSDPALQTDIFLMNSN
jgi:hypothetical protein